MNKKQNGWLQISMLSLIALGSILIVGKYMNPTMPERTNAQVVSSSLTLTPLCSSNPTSIRSWKVSNPNNSNITFTWEVYPNLETGSLSAPANSDVFFNTQTVAGNNLVKVYANSVLQTESPSISTQCVSSQVDLNVKTVVNKSNSSAGDLLKYTITYGNSGTVTANNTKVSINLGTNTLFVSSTKPGNFQGNSYVMNVGPLAPGQTQAIIIFANVSQWYQNGTVQTTTTISSDSAETVLGNNSSSTITSVQPNPNACVDQSLSNVGIQINYTYISPLHDVLIQSINFNSTLFPGVIVATKVKQVYPIPNQQEISTDRGDLAYAGLPNEEDPGEAGILEYLGNNNLNNIIDIEGILNSAFDLEFSEPLLDNNPSPDGYSEILIFERGMNSDLRIQAVDDLGGNVIGNPITLTRNTQIPLGIKIDTLEIGSAQNVGYRRVDLNDLNVPYVTHLRVFAQPGYNGPDIKIIGIRTKQCSVAEADLATLITPNVSSIYPGGIFEYKVEYMNNGPDEGYQNVVSVTLDPGLTLLSGSMPYTMSGGKYLFDVGDLQVGQSGQLMLTVQAGLSYSAGDAITSYSDIRGIVFDPDLTNNPDEAVIAVKQLKKLEVTAICSSSNPYERIWKLRNDNSISMSANRNVNNVIFGSGILLPGDTYVATTGLLGINTFSLFVNGVLQSSKGSNSVLCNDPVADLGIIITHKPGVFLTGSEVIYYVDYYNLGPSRGDNVRMSVKLYSGLSLSGVSIPYTISGGLLYFSVGDLAVGQTGQFIITTNLLFPIDYFKAFASIWGDVIDPFTGNNQDDDIIALVGGGLGQEILTGDIAGTGDDSGTGFIFTGKNLTGTEEIELESAPVVIETEEGTYTYPGCQYNDEPYREFNFEDIVTNRAKPDILMLQYNCIVRGRKPNFFAPGGSITNSEAIKIFTKLRGIKYKMYLRGERYIYLGNTPLYDVPNTHWSAVYMDYAYSLGLIDHMIDEKGGRKYIDPNKAITREDATILMMKTYSLINNVAIDELTGSAFPDLHDGDYKKYIVKAEKLGFINGRYKDGQRYFFPDDFIRRDEMSKIVARPFKNVLYDFVPKIKK